ncbi:MAG: hypothetical protein P1U86_04360 [Verrucomicrobiales bacterium]|nr:hypothetical protein [Verrucomicrobiales bacterium]
MNFLSYFRSAGNSLRILSLGAILSYSVSLTGCGLIGPTAQMAIALAPLKLLFACLPEGTQIDIPGGESRAVESLKAGEMIVGYDGEPVRIRQISGYLEDPEESEFLAVTFTNGSTVDLCTMHRIGGVRAKELIVGSTVSDGHEVESIRSYRGVERSYDILTEDGGYRIGGIPVNSMIEEMYEAGQTGKISD